jgi:hypothetical protein
LIACLARLEANKDLNGVMVADEVKRRDAKMDLIAITSALMPDGRPKYLETVKYPTIKQLIAKNGRKTMLKVIFLMIQDLCNSLNVKYNMSEDQMIEAAAVMLDECDNFRLEDYQMMFALGKRGNLVEIMHTIDISVIGRMMDEYYIRRKNAVQQHYEEQKQIEADRIAAMTVPTGTAMVEGKEYTFSDLVKDFTKWKEENDEIIEQGKLSERYKVQQEWLQHASLQGVNVDEIVKQFSKKKP